jgi:hypothetical protein
MDCQTCSAPNADDHIFCGKCGSRLGDTVGNLSSRVKSIEQELEASRHAISSQNLEIETADRIIARVESSTKRFLFFAGIPAAIAALALAIIWGKGAWTLSNFAASARSSVGAVLAQAQTQAGQARDTAQGALQTAKQVESKIETTRQQIMTLKTEVDTSSGNVQKLNGQLADAQSKLDAIKKQLGTGTQLVQQLTTQIQEVKTEKTQADIETYYPIYGRHVARSAVGFMDPSKKLPGAVYVAIALSLTTPPNVSSKQVAEGAEALSKKYTVVFGPIFVEALTAHSAQTFGIRLDDNTCLSWVRPSLQPPCIIYFQESLRQSALEVRDILKVTQPVPDSHVVFSDPKNLSPEQKEVLSLSGIDIAVVLGGQ